MKYITAFNKEIDTPCIGCTVAENIHFKEGQIHQSKLWNLAQDFEIAYPGMIILSPTRHVSTYTDLTKNELKELQVLITHCKKAIKRIFNCDKVAYMFYEKPTGHIHFIIIPLHGLVEIKDKYAVLAELMAKTKALRNDKENMTQVINAISKLKDYFKNI